MCGPAYDSDSVLALPTAAIAVMGAEPAVNAVYFNKMATMSNEEKKNFIREKTLEYEKDVNIYRMASELVVDMVIDFSEVRSELGRRLEVNQEKQKTINYHNSIQPM
jgi:acetyl-CoA carboxylase carboxyltransferase component